MMKINYLKTLTNKFNYFINYIHYLKSSVVKNTYPCKLIGENIEPNQQQMCVNVKMLGKNEFIKWRLSELFENRSLLGCISPLDAVKLGALSFKEIVLNLPTAMQKDKFQDIKKIMLSSKNVVLGLIIPNKVGKHPSIPAEFVKINNYYPCKLISNKVSQLTNETIIIYSISGKREGYEKRLIDIIDNPALLLKFHPTDAIKFGFIHAGDKIFK